MAPVRIAVIGAGLIGRKHIAVLRSGNPDYTLAAVADPAPAAAAEAKKLGYQCFAEVEDMLDRVKPDGAIVAVPNQMHVPVGLACVERKVAILVEKPVADFVETALDLVEAAERAGVPFLVGHHRRHNPIMRKAAEIIRGGGVGKVVAASGFWLSHKPKDYFNFTWRKEPGGGTVLINAIHDIDCLRMLCGDVETVQASASSATRNFPVEDTAAAVLRFKNGALGTFLISDTASTPWTWEWTSHENPFYPHEPENCYFIAGTKGSLAVPSLQHRWYEAGAENWGKPLTQLRAHIVPADAYYEQMRNFAGAIRGAEEPVLSGRGGTITLATTLAITQSAKTGMPVRVDDMMARAPATQAKPKRAKRTG
jgi:predicted dehydrogenase